MSSTCQIHAQQPEHAQTMHAVQQYVRSSGCNGQRGGAWCLRDAVTPHETPCTYDLCVHLKSAKEDLYTRSLSVAIGVEVTGSQAGTAIQSLGPLRLLRQGRPGSLKLAFAIYPVSAITRFGVTSGCPRIPGQACDRACA